MSRWKEKVPLAAIGQYRKLHSLMKRLLKQLLFGRVSLTLLQVLLDLDKGNWLAWRVAKGKVNPRPFYTVLRYDRLRVVNRPSKHVQQSEHYTL